MPSAFKMPVGTAACPYHSHYGHRIGDRDKQPDVKGAFNSGALDHLGQPKVITI